MADIACGGGGGPELFTVNCEICGDHRPGTDSDSGLDLFFFNVRSGPHDMPGSNRRRWRESVDSIQFKDCKSSSSSSPLHQAARQVAQSRLRLLIQGRHCARVQPSAGEARTVTSRAGNNVSKKCAFSGCQPLATPTCSRHAQLYRLWPDSIPQVYRWLIGPQCRPGGDSRESFRHDRRRQASNASRWSSLSPPGLLSV